MTTLYEASLALWARRTFAFVVAAASGAVAYRLGSPLPWLLGPLFSIGALALAGWRLPPTPMAREFGHATIGTAVGLRFTPAVLAAAAGLLPAMVIATIYVVAFTMLTALLFRPLARVSSCTAFFATAAGGMAEMAQIAAARGGDASAVAVVHALRVSGVVAIVPFVLLGLNAEGLADAGTAAPQQGVWWQVLLLLPLVLLWAALLRRITPIPNPWLVGPLLLAAALGASGVVSFSLPPVLIVLAQIALGIFLGSRFQREQVLALPRVSLAAVAAVLFMVSCAFVGALALAGATSLSLGTAFLALAPAAVGEMVLTAQVMNLDAEMVTAFHVMRIAVISTTIVMVHRIFNWLRGESDGPYV